MGVSLGMIADVFAEYISEESWRCRKAEFFALRDMEVPARPALTQMCLDIAQESPRQCEQDAMELEPCRSVPEFEAGRQCFQYKESQTTQFAPEMMCFN
jgi:hypothetical protein